MTAGGLGGLGDTQAGRARGGTAIVYRGVGGEGLAFRSTDGGTTWNIQTTPSLGAGGFPDAGHDALVAGTGLRWSLSSYPSVGVYVSADDGINWNNITSGFFPGSGSGNVLTDGAGTQLFFSDNGTDQAFSLDNGVTWQHGFATPFSTIIGGSSLALFDGTQYVAFVRTGGSNIEIWTAPVGFGGGGPVWTMSYSSASPTGGPFPSSNPLDGAVGYDPAVGYLSTSGGTNFPVTPNGIIISPTLAGLLTAPTITPTGWVLNTNNVNGVWYGGGMLLVCDRQGNLFSSGDGGTTWATDTTNFAIPGEAVQSFCYDSVHAMLMIFGSRGSISTQSAGTAVPDVTGLSLAAATAAITGAGFTLGTVSFASSMVIDLGFIISQVPVGGTVVAGGTPVNLTESTGPTVPNIVGDTFVVGQAALTAAGLTVGLVTSALNPAPAGQIFSQSPVAGSTGLHLGAGVNFSISLGSISDIVPNIVGLSASGAAIALLNAGLDLGNVVFVNTDAQLPGNVVTQAIPAGTPVAPGTMIDVTIAALVPAFDVDVTVISQYANSPTIIRLVENMAEYLDPRTNFEQFYNFVWNVDTAKGFGLDIWGRIVGVSRLLQLGNSGQPFGFENADIPFDWQNFGGGTFFTGGSGSSVILADDPYRVLILTKALANITATTSQALNKLLRNLFPGRGACFVRDNLDMTMTYVFKFTLTPIEFAILTQSGVMPHPAGVGFNVVVIPPAVFGFSEAGFGVYLPFNFGIFYLPP